MFYFNIWIGVPDNSSILIYCIYKLVLCSLKCFPFKETAIETNNLISREKQFANKSLYNSRETIL